MNLIKDDFTRVPGNKISDGIYKILDEYNAIPVAYHRLAKTDDRDMFVFQVMINSNGILSYNRIVISINLFTNKFKGFPVNNAKILPKM